MFVEYWDFAIPARLCISIGKNRPLQEIIANWSLILRIYTIEASSSDGPTTVYFLASQNYNK